MSEKPAVLISDDLIKLLENSAITKAMFADLADTPYPWEVDLRRFKECRKKLLQIEKHIRSANPELSLTCVIAGKGAFWLPTKAVHEFLEKLQQPVNQLKLNGPMPVWKMTSTEIFQSHLSNLKQLVLSVAYDFILLHQIRERLGEHHEFLQQEFDNCEIQVRNLLDLIQDQAPNLDFVTHKDIILMERCRVTMEMIDQHFTNEKDLGYSRNDLLQAIKILDNRLHKEMPSYSKRINTVYNELIDHLRNGENTSLTRTSRWEIAFTLLNSLPSFLKGHAALNELEQEGLEALVLSREAELGESKTGKHALESLQQAETVKQKTATTQAKTASIKPKRPVPSPGDSHRMIYPEKDSS